MGDSLQSILENMSYQGHKGTLQELMRNVSIKPRAKKKTDAVEALLKFYSDSESAARLFQQLTAYEKALLTCIVQSKYRPLTEDLREVANTYKYKENTNRFYDNNYREKFFPKDSKLNAFFIKGIIPPRFKEYLEKIIPPYTRVFHTCKVENIDKYAAITGREQRYKDFDMLLSFINNNKTSATKAGGYMNKNALLKFHQIAKYDDICNNETGKLEDIRNTSETTVSFGMIQLLKCADVIDIIKDKFVLSQNATSFARFSMMEKATFLFEAYIRCDNSVIDECARISAAKLKFPKSIYDLSGPRQEIISYLQECPVNEWISFKKFSNELYKTNNCLFEVVGNPLIRDDYYNQYYDYAVWNDFEYCAVSVMLMEYLATLGAVDVLAVEASHSDYDYYSAYETEYFRITDLGAFLFGITDSYQEKLCNGVSESAGGFIVQPNFDIVIQNSNERMRHELFFDRFAEKTVTDTEVSVYKLNFKSMVKALDIGFTIREISSYCETFSSVPLPDNVVATFSEWELQSSKIRIRTITVIETDDRYLLEEIKHYKGMNLLSEGDINSVLTLMPHSDKKAKKLIERNKRFCVLEN